MRKPRSFPENYRFQIPDELPLAGCAEGRDECRAGAPDRHARHRAGQPAHALRHLRRCAVDEQGPPLGCAAARSDRALLPAVAGKCRGPGGCARAVVRIPDQEVRRRHQQEGRRVLHPALRGAAHGEHSRSARGRVHLRSCLRHRRHAARGHPPCAGDATATTARSGASSTVRRKTSPPPPSPA